MGSAGLTACRPGTASPATRAQLRQSLERATAFEVQLATGPDC
ncbi:MAG: hypothetical protein ACI9F9_000932, partial [Candidatus Paceibacteria bacterium]